MLPTFVGDRHDALVRVTPDIGELAHDQWLVTHPEERFRPAVRGVIDRLYSVAKSIHETL